MPGDVPARVWPEIRQLTGAVGAVAPDVALLLSPEPSDLPSPVDDTDTVLGVTPVAVVTPVASTVAPETPAVPIVPSWTTERFLPLRGSGQATIRLSAQPLTEQQEYTGEIISMNFENIDLRAVLRVFAEISGLNLVIDPSVQGEVNVVLNLVPWD